MSSDPPFETSAHTDSRLEHPKRISPHAVADVLTNALGSLDDSVIGKQLYEAFIAAVSACTPPLTPRSIVCGKCRVFDTHCGPGCAEIGDQRSRLYVLRLLIERLPEENQAILRWETSCRGSAQTALPASPGGPV